MVEKLGKAMRREIMGTTLIKNAKRIYTFDEKCRVFDTAYIIVKGNVIKEIGTGIPPPDNYNEVIDASNYVVIPGLINTHHHFFQNLTRSVPKVQKCNLLEWLLHLYRIWRYIDEETVYYGSLVSMAELLLTGCTTTLDLGYLYPTGAGDLLGAEVRAAEEIGMRVHLIRGSMPVMEGHLAEILRNEYGIDTDALIEDKDAILSQCEQAFQKYHDPNELSMCQIGVGPTSTVYDDANFMRELKAVADQYDGIAHVHLHPRPDEIKICKKLHNRTPVEYLNDIGWLDNKTVIAHATRFTKEDIAIVSECNTGITHSPSCHMRLGYPVAPIPTMLKSGIRVGIGVDGGASNDSGDMLAELRLTMLVHRIQGIHGNLSPEEWLGPKEVFRLATTGGSSLLGRNDIGCLATGKAADIAMFDLNQIGYAGGLHDPLGALVYCHDRHPAAYVMVNGEILVSEGKLVRIKEKEICHKANLLATKLVSRLKNE